MLLYRRVRDVMRGRRINYVQEQGNKASEGVMSNPQHNESLFKITTYT